MLRPSKSLISLSVAVLTASIAWATPQEISAAQIEADLAFAKGLAGQWGFVDIAESVLKGLDGKNLSGAQEDSAALVGAELYSQSARLAKEPAKRRELYDRAIEEFKAFLDTRSTSALRSEAETALVGAAYTYSQYLSQDLEEAVGEEATALRDRQIEVLTETVSLTGESVASLQSIPGEERTERQKQQMWSLMLQRGQMLAMIAKTSEDQEYYYTLAMDALEELSGVAGDGTPGAFYAFDSMGTIYADQNKWDDAALFYDAVLESTIPFEAPAWEQIKTDYELSAPDVALRFNFVQLSADGAIEAYAQSGDQEGAIMRALYFLNIWKKEGMSLNRQGQESALVAARVLLGTSGFIGGDFQKGEVVWFATEDEMKGAVRAARNRTDTTNFAISLASEINDTSEYGYLRTRAKKLLAEIAETPGIDVSPQLQMEGLEGEYRSGNYDVAIDKAHRLASVLSAGDDSTRLELMPKLYYILGNIYLRQERTLEAAFAFREGVVNYSGGDLEKDSSSARSYNKLMNQLVDATNTASPLTKMVTESENLVSKHASDDAGAIQFNGARKLENRGEFEAAITKYKIVPLEEDFGELALAQTGYCHIKLKQYDLAQGVFERYLNEVIPDPQYDTESERRKGNRRQALSVTEFFLATCLYRKSDYAKTVELLDGYAERHKSQTGLSEKSLSLLMRCQLNLGAMDEAQKALEGLVAIAPEKRVTSSASTAFYLKLRELYDAETDEGAKSALLLRMATRLEAANAAGSANYGNLWNEANHWSDLEQYDKSLKALRRILSAFGDTTDPAVKEKIDKFVIPRTGEILLANKEVQEASDLLTPLILKQLEDAKNDTLSKKEKFKVGKAATIVWTRTLTGWLEGGKDGERIVEVPGIGDAETAPELWSHATTQLDIYARQRESYSCEWFETKFTLSYAWYRWGQIDSSKGASVKQQLLAISVLLGGESWSDVDQVCDKEENEAIRKRTAGHTLRNHYRWLEERAK